MDCSIPPPLTEDELSAALDDAASAAVQQHLAHCAYCKDRLEAARRIEQGVKRKLYQFDCPTSQQLVDYDTGLLDPVAATTIRRHVETCPRCQVELGMIQRFLDDDADARPALQIVHSVRHRPRQRIAQPRADVGAWAARGSQDGDTQDWEAEGATIFLELNRRAGGLVLSGQVVDDQPIWVGALAELRQAGTLQGVSVLDELAEFRFMLSEPEPVALNITAPNGVTLVLENITLSE
jgi:anti-sigma factor RsiW